MRFLLTSKLEDFKIFLPQYADYRFYMSSNSDLKEYFPYRLEVFYVSIRLLEREGGWLSQLIRCLVTSYQSKAEKLMKKCLNCYLCCLLDSQVYVAFLEKNKMSVGLTKFQLPDVQTIRENKLYYLNSSPLWDLLEWLMQSRQKLVPGNTL